MRLLLDINIILDVVFRRPGEPVSSAQIATCGRQNQAWLAWHSVVTLAYLIDRQDNADSAIKVIDDLLNWAQVATVGHADALKALAMPMRDFEDALQVTAALACNATNIITRNGRDYVGTAVPANSPEELLARHPPV